jgi:hypothetical protein
MQENEEEQSPATESTSDPLLTKESTTTPSLLALNKMLRRLAGEQIDYMMKMGLVAQDQRRYLTRKQFAHMAKSLSLQQKLSLYDLKNSENDFELLRPKPELRETS